MNYVDAEQDTLTEVGVSRQILQLFDLQPDVSVFIKDAKGRFVFLNRRSCEYCGVKSEPDALGKTDMDFFPPQRAALYQSDDKRVLESGNAILNRIEPAPEADSSSNMVVVNKIPLRNAEGKVVAVAGFTRRISQFRSPNVSKQLSDAMDYLHKNFSTELKTRDLAEKAKMSVRQFERTFKNALGLTVRQYILRIRMDHAKHLLRDTEETISSVALDVGFYDHAHFTRIFSRENGVTPKVYRKQSLSEAF